ncbi:MAG: hypothetical protein J6R85_02330, partial [Lentisphaeria bacterium]|nr:hypothetical protein [Lentisphaeria bacterium]
MRSKFAIGMLCLASLVLPLAGNAAGPEYQELRPQLKKVHPRLFLTPETKKTFADDVKRLAMKDFEALKAHVDSLPDNPEITLRPRYTKMQDGKIIFIRNIGDQNHVIAGLKNGDAGLYAVECVIAYFVTNEAKYKEKALRYAQNALDIFALSDRSEIMPEWFHYNRLCMLITYDWLYPELSVEQRKSIIVPLIQHIEHMRLAKYKKDNGGYTSGNYGEPGLMWFAGVTAAGDGFCDELAENLLSLGYAHVRKMMDFRDDSSGGSGVLASIAEGYTFANYPFATFNFLHTLQSGFGIDGTKYWNQMRDYPKSVAWMVIPYRGAGEEFLNYGWGDTCHYRNNIWGMKWLYAHMAQCIHFYGENPVARAILAHLPEKFNGYYEYLTYLPFLPFVVRNFDPKANVCADPAKALDTGIAYTFPSFGLTVMRSG